MFTGTNVNIISVDQFTAFAPEVDLTQYPTVTVSGLISQASQLVADYLEYTPVAEAIVDEVKDGLVTREGDLLLFPAKIPIISVTSIALFKGTVSIDLTLSSAGVNRYNIDYNRRKLLYPGNELALSGEFILTNFYNLRENHFFTKMTYRGGFEPYAMPESIKYATVLYVRELLSRNDNPNDLSSLSQGAISMSFGSSGMGKKSKFVQEAERVLGPYRRMG